jgi:hypothetical protein
LIELDNHRAGKVEPYTRGAFVGRFVVYKGKHSPFNQGQEINMSEAVTIERLERALAFCAHLVVRDGPVVVPIFERLEPRGDAQQ